MVGDLFFLMIKNIEATPTLTRVIGSQSFSDQWEAWIRRKTVHDGTRRANACNTTNLQKTKKHIKKHPSWANRHVNGSAHPTRSSQRAYRPTAELLRHSDDLLLRVRVYLGHLSNTTTRWLSKRLILTRMYRSKLAVFSSVVVSIVI